MRLTGLGKTVLLMLALGIAFGGYRFFQQSQAGGRGTAGGQGGSGNSGGGGFKLPSLGGNKGSSNTGGGNNGGGNNGGTNTGGGQQSGGQQTGGPPGGAGGVEIPFVITAAKKDWVGEQVDRFNAQNGGKYRVVTQPSPSREAMHAILGGTLKPVLWSPGSPIWPARLAEAYQAKNGRPIVDLNDPNGYRVFLRSPLVFMTTKDKARFLRPLLGGPNSWEMLRQLSMGKRKTPFGPLSWSHADPLTSSSGMLTLGLVMYNYAQRTGQAGQLDRLATNKQFISYVKELERGLVYDTPAEKGTTALTKSFLESPSRYDVITGYESAALEAAPKNPNIAVIYPNPTAVSEHSVSLLQGEWVTPEQKAGAEAFLRFLGEKESLQAGLKYYFRPAQAGGSLSLAPQLAQFASQGFQQSFAPIELPPYEALNSAAFQWRIQVVGKTAG